MYLRLNGERGLRPPKGITSMPVLHLDGRITSAEGYDPDTGLRLHNVPDCPPMLRRTPRWPAFGTASAPSPSPMRRWSATPSSAF